MGTVKTTSRAVLTSTHNLCFEQKYEKYQFFFFFIENFQFLETKFSIYLNRRVFVMFIYYYRNIFHFSEFYRCVNSDESLTTE